MQRYTLDYEAKLQKVIMGARNPQNNEINESDLSKLIDDYASSPYDYDTYLYPYLNEKTRQVNAINIFYTQTASQDEPQIAVFSEANIPHGLVSDHILFVLTLYVLPNVTTDEYTAYTKLSKQERENPPGWFNNFTTIGYIGSWWRDFRTFFQLNMYQVSKCYLFLQPLKKYHL